MFLCPPFPISDMGMANLNANIKIGGDYMFTLEAAKYVFETLRGIRDSKKEIEFCREIIFSEISYNLNLLDILVNKKEVREKEIIIKVLKRLKTEAYETVLSAGRSLNDIFKDTNNNTKEIQPQNNYDKRAITTFKKCESQYKLIENLYQRIHILKIIGEENLLNAVRGTSRINFAHSLMRLAIDNIRNK